MKFCPRHKELVFNNLCQFCRDSSEESVQSQVTTFFITVTSPDSQLLELLDLEDSYKESNKLYLALKPQEIK